MVSHFKHFFMLGMVLGLGICLEGCLSYQILKQVDGPVVTLTADSFEIGRTTMAQVLNQLGAPRTIKPLEQHNVLIYYRTVSNDRKLSLALPLSFSTNGYDISATGAITKTDTLALVFTPQGILDHYIYVQASETPFFKTLFQ